MVKFIGGFDLFLIYEFYYLNSLTFIQILAILERKMSALK